MNPKFKKGDKVVIVSRRNEGQEIPLSRKLIGQRATVIAIDGDGCCSIEGVTGEMMFQAWVSKYQIELARGMTDERLKLLIAIDEL